MFYACRQAGYEENPVDPVEKVPPQAAKFFYSKKGAVEECPTQ
jgi:hypothetical protein